MESCIQETRNGFEMAVDEVERLYSENVKGVQEETVRKEMKAWAISNGMVTTAEYKDIVSAHAKARGWTQEGFTGMEVCDPFWDWQED